MQSLAPTPSQDLQELAKRVMELWEGLQRISDVTGIPLLPVPSSPGRRLSAVPPLPA